MYQDDEIDRKTGLYTRESILKKVKVCLAEKKIVSIALMDIDFFTNINQKIGINHGDEVLKGIAELIRQEGFMAGRYGGDEFIFLFTDQTAEQIEARMEEFQKKFKKKRFISIYPYEKVRMTFSMGISCCLEQCQDYFLLLKSAESALFNAKKNGRNRVVCSRIPISIIPKTERGVCTTVIGCSLKGASKDGEAAFTAALAEPYGVAVTKSGNLVYVDRSNHQIKYIQDGKVFTLAGKGESGYSGDGGRAEDACLCKPSGVAISETGRIYIADTGNNCIRKIDNGIITTIAGNGENGRAGDGGDARQAQLSRPGGIVVDAQENLYTNDYGNNVIRKIDCNGIITTVAGCGTFGYSGDGGDARQACLDKPYGLGVDLAGCNLFIADYGNHCIRQVDLKTGIIVTFAGTGRKGYSGDGGDCHKAELNGPFWVYPKDEILYIADAFNHCIRAIDMESNRIMTVAGNGSAGYQDQRKDKGQVMFHIPAGMAVFENMMYVADYGNNSIRKFELS